MDRRHDGGDGRSAGLVRWLDAAKRHPIVVGAAALLAVATFVTTAWALARDTVDFVDDLANPHGELYEQLGLLALDVTPEYVDRALGPPTTVLDPGIDCPDCGALSLRVYRLGDDASVRALFEESTLRMFTVTRVGVGVHPAVRWSGADQGSLGEDSFAGSSSVSGDGPMTPTDVAFWPGAQRTTYVEAFAFGAPGDYEGLILGHTTDGASDTPMDLDGARAVADGVGDTTAGLSPDATAFRSEASPNTFGAFRDDGPLASQLRDADVIAALLVVGTYR